MEYENLTDKVIGCAYKVYVSVQADLVKLPAGFINDGTGIPFK